MKIYRCNVFERGWGEDSVDVPYEHIEEFQEVMLPTEDLQRTPWQDISQGNFDMVTTEQLVGNGTSADVNGTSIIKVVDGEDTMYYHYAGYQRTLQGLDGQPGIYRVQFIRDEGMSHQLYRLRNNMAQGTNFGFYNKHMDRYLLTSEGKRYVDYMQQPGLKTLNTSLPANYQMVKQNVNDFAVNTTYDLNQFFAPCRVLNWSGKDGSKPSNTTRGYDRNDYMTLYDGSQNGQRIPYETLNPIIPMASDVTSMPYRGQVTGEWINRNSGQPDDWTAYKKTGFNNWKDLDAGYALDNEGTTYRYVIVTNFQYKNCNQETVNLFAEYIQYSDGTNAGANPTQFDMMIIPGAVKLVNKKQIRTLCGSSEEWSEHYPNPDESDTPSRPIFGWGYKSDTQVDSFEDVKQALIDLYGIDIGVKTPSGPIISIVASPIAPSTLSSMLLEAHKSGIIFCPYNITTIDGKAFPSINNAGHWAIYEGQNQGELHMYGGGSQYANLFVGNIAHSYTFIKNILTGGSYFFDKTKTMLDALNDTHPLVTNDNEPMLYTPAYGQTQLLIKKGSQGSITLDMLDLQNMYDGTHEINLDLQFLDVTYYKGNTDCFNAHYPLSSCEEELLFVDDRTGPYLTTSGDQFLSQSATTLNTSRSLAQTTAGQQTLSQMAGVGDVFRNPTSILQKTANMVNIGVNYSKEIQKIDSQTANLVNAPASLTLPPFVGALFNKPTSYLVTNELTDLSKDSIGAYIKAYGYIVNKMMPSKEILNRVEFNYFKVDPSINKNEIIRNSVKGNHPLTPFYAQKEFGNIYCERLDRGIRLHIGGIHHIDSQTNYERDTKIDLSHLLYRRDLHYTNLTVFTYNLQLQYTNTDNISGENRIYNPDFPKNLSKLVYDTIIEYINTDNISGISDLEIV